MKWQSEGFLLGKRKFRENASIIDVFTNDFGKVSGIVYGGNSRKIRNFLQIGNRIFLFYNSKNESKIGYFKTELVEPISPKYFSDSKRTSAILSLSSILQSLLPESQPNKKIYNSINEFIKNIDTPNWPLLYIYLELNIIKELGFNPNLIEFKNQSKNLKEINDFNIDGVLYKIPKYLIENILPDNVDNDIIRKSLIFTRSIILNKFYLPNNLIFPKSRIIFENYYN
tara:strand:- start:117 stop:797 length:681 start_codon:yes stop_codon:yes gene_type:complete